MFDVTATLHHDSIENSKTNGNFIIILSFVQWNLKSF